MLAPSNGLLRAGLALKLSQVKLATRSYLRDRTNQASDSVASHAVAAGLFAAAGILLIAACLVAVAALFRWIEINHGLFWAFGAVGALLLAISALCAAMAASRLRRPSRHFPSLASRLRVAVKANPLEPDPIEAAGNAAVDVLLASSSPAPQNHRRRPKARPWAARDNRSVAAGLVLAATLLGWAAARRRQQARRMEV